MSSVHVDENAILKTNQNLRNAISSIEMTRTSILKKYRKLGFEWNDTKYKELGDIVQECNSALNSILKILVQAEKSISLLVKHLQEYNELSLGNSTGSQSEFYSVNSNNSNTYTTEKTEVEKLLLFKKGLAKIENLLSSYADNLNKRGLKTVVVMDAILNHYRHLKEAELICNLNGDFSISVPALTDADFDEIISNCSRSGLANYTDYENLPRSLTETRYKFKDQIINGIRMRVYNDPIGTNSLLIKKQGTSHYPMRGTCGLCQCANLLTLAGIQGSNEDSIISSAIHESDYVLNYIDLFNPRAGERGGTTADSRQRILFSCGLPTYCLPIDNDLEATVHNFSEIVRTGHGIIVSVDVAYLWRNGQRGAHAISLISVTEDGGTFIYNDTGRGIMGTISAQDLARALTSSPANVTVNVIR